MDMAEPQRPEDLERLADEQFWAGDFDGSIATPERAYTLYREQGDERRAGLMANSSVSAS